MCQVVIHSPFLASSSRPPLPGRQRARALSAQSPPWSQLSRPGPRYLNQLHEASHCFSFVNYHLEKVPFLWSYFSRIRIYRNKFCYLTDYRMRDIVSSNRYIKTKLRLRGQLISFNTHSKLVRYTYIPRLLRAFKIPVVTLYMV